MAATTLALALGCSTALADLTTAYEALRIVGESRGAGFFNRLIELRGERGQAQPASWSLLFREPTSASGIRVLVVQDGRLVSEQVPVQPPPPTPPPLINPSSLNLNSDGAFRVANDEAYKRKVGFDAVNYRLLASGPGATPIWSLELLDTQARRVAFLAVDATSGALVRFEIPPEPVAPGGPESDRFIDRAGRTITSAGRAAQEKMLEIGDYLEGFFRGGSKP